MSNTTNEFSTEVRERAVRMVLDNAGQHESRWSAILSISSKICCAPQTLNDWIKKSDVDRVEPLRHDGVACGGIIVLMLWGAALEVGFSSPYWMTFKQAKELGANVKKASMRDHTICAWRLPSFS